MLSFIFATKMNLKTNKEQHFSKLAQEFLNGRLYFSEVPSESGWADTSPHNGYLYWPLGIMPAIIMMPFVALFDPDFGQGFISLPLTFTNTFIT
ncbi:hypothetical protein KBG31_01205 [Patescibacteria group bacterium]|nr:hypothetical protein [Patescibacteria group bacterium]